MKITVIPVKDQFVSEKDLISYLMGEEIKPSSPPEADLGLAQKAVDFWVTEWQSLGVEVCSAELHTEFDPEESYWYFVIELFIDLKESLEYSVDKEMKIIDKMVSIDPLPEWFMGFTVVTTRRSL